MIEKKNPAIILYHKTEFYHLPQILKEGLIGAHDTFEYCDIERKGLAKGWTSSEIFKKMCESTLIKARMAMDSQFPERNNSVFFWKNIDDIPNPQLDEIVLEIPADKIPCRCKEANVDLALVLKSDYKALFDENMPEGFIEWMKEHEKEYRETIRDLDTNPNNYPTEVFCHCNIPPDIIEINTQLGFKA